MTTWDTRDQAYANRIALLTSSEYSERKAALVNFTREMQSRGITWSLSCSANLYLRGLVDDFNDFDVLFDIKDTEEVKATMVAIGGTLINTVQKRYFTSPFYQEAMLNGVHFDLIGNMTVATFGKSYLCQILPDEIHYAKLGGNVNVPLAPVEANMLLYGMMEGWQQKRRLKRDLCYKYILENGVKYPTVFERALEQALPDFLEEVIIALLNKSDSGV